MSWFLLELESAKVRTMCHVLCLVLAIVIVSVVWRFWSESNLFQTSSYSAMLMLQTIILVACLVGILLIWLLIFILYLRYSYAKKHREKWKLNHYTTPRNLAIVIGFFVVLVFVGIWVLLERIALLMQGINVLLLELSNFNVNHVWIPFAVTIVVIVVMARFQLRYLPPMNVNPPMKNILKK